MNSSSFQHSRSSSGWLLSVGTVILLSAASALLALTLLSGASLINSISQLNTLAKGPDLLQMHTGEVNFQKLEAFAADHPEIESLQISPFLNLASDEVVLNGQNLAASNQDHGVVTQNEAFDFLLDDNGQKPEVKPGEIYLPSSYKALYQLEPGLPITLAGQPLILAGFVQDVQMNSMMSSSKRFLVCPEDYEKLKPDGEVEWLIEYRLKEGGDPNALAQAYEQAVLPANGPMITGPLITLINAISDGTTVLVLLLISIVVLLIALICVHFILSIQLTQDRKEIGLMKALGISRRQIQMRFFKKYILFSLMAFVIGIFVALACSSTMLRQLQELYGKGLQVQFSLFWAVIGALIPEVIILCSLWISLKKMDRLSALQALFENDRPKSRLQQTLLVGLLCGCCAFLVCVPLNLYTTLEDPGFVRYMGIGQSQIRIDLRQNSKMDSTLTDQFSSLRTQLQNDPEVSRFCLLETRRMNAITKDGSTVSLLVEQGDHSVFPVQYAKGHAPENDQEIALSSLNAQALRLDVGSTLQIDWNGERKTMEVCGIYADVTNGGKTAKTRAEDSSLPIIWSVGYVTLNPDTSVKDWMSRYQSEGYDVIDLQDYIQSTYSQTLSQLQLALRMAMVLSAIVLFVVLFLFMRLLVERSRYELSLQKAFGLSSRHLILSEFKPALLTVGLGLGAGILTGDFGGQLICGQILAGLGACGFNFTINWPFNGLVFLILFGLGVIALLLAFQPITGIQPQECCHGRE